MKSPVSSLSDYLRRLVPAFILLVCGASAPAAQLLAEVDARWSPFYTAPVPLELANLVAESRDLLQTNPARVLQTLSQMKPGSGPMERLILGLRADAAYQLGGDSLLEAQRLYRIIASSADNPAVKSWAHFMAGTIDKGLGLLQEAENEFVSSREDGDNLWAAAVDFNTAVLKLEDGRYREADIEFSRWLERYPQQPGRALVMYLSGECATRLNDPPAARSRFRIARGLDDSVWTARPEVGMAMADLLLEEADLSAAVAVMEQLAASAPGTVEGCRALLRAGEIWQQHDRIANAARVYARLLDGASTFAEGREARIRLALLGVQHADTVELTEPYAAYRLFYRPRPVLEEFAAGREPLDAQRALQGIAELERREGRVGEALRVLSLVFLRYPESLQSGRAYEAFMGLLQGYLAQLFRDKRYETLLDLYHGSQQAMGWAPTRDVGAVSLIAAEAYRIIGAPEQARAVYQEMLRSGTRVLTADELGVKILATRVSQGELQSLREWVARFSDDWEAHLALGRALATQGLTEEALAAFRRAEQLARVVTGKWGARVEQDRLKVPNETAAGQLQDLQARRVLWRALPDGKERAAWETEEGLTEARLQFATGGYRRAISLYQGKDSWSPADRYVRALAELASQREPSALQQLEMLSETDDPLFSGLAELHRSVLLLTGTIRGLL